MPSKRRNNGRSKHGRGHTAIMRCSNCYRAVPKDKAVRKFVVRTIVDTSSARDLKEQSAIDTYQLPRLYIKQQYCVSCAIHARIVRVRSADARRVRKRPSRDPVQAPRGGK
ncbi:unnamed protein product [Amoebophrya sp. A120]|nr:unnamed protein product [Amoebophrya sp. A120]|eukprot:GSA120T00017666001.1